MAALSLYRPCRVSVRRAGSHDELWHSTPLHSTNGGGGWDQFDEDVNGLCCFRSSLGFQWRLSFDYRGTVGGFNWRRLDCKLSISQLLTARRNLPEVMNPVAFCIDYGV
ncbi:uncharacterized protein LOC143208197 [Lasioglossum baleicum]|uniref:uncharacterized protein LOC143208197 n=1 Tax=Lasioglossum baleicum TaxID=434251 RepID=UPI003FCE8A52